MAGGRRLSRWLLKLLEAQTQAELVEHISSTLIATTSIPGGAIRFFTPSPIALRRACHALSKEPDTIAWLDDMADSAVLWDIGANVGTYGIYAAVRRRAVVLCFEPSAANYYVLTRNIQLNGLAPRVMAYCLALTNKTELGILSLASTSIGAALSQFGEHSSASPYWDENVQPELQGMVGLTIDDMIKLFGAPFPNYLKVDVDGLELAILEGAKQTLADGRVRSVLVELSLDGREERRRAFDLLEAAGLRYVSKGETQATATASAANFVFGRKS